MVFVLCSCSLIRTRPIVAISSTASPTPFPTITFEPSSTPFPPTATITPETLSGLTLWQVNVRSGPGITYALLGQINQNQPVQITGVDAGKEWFSIIYPSGSQNRGWVTTQYIQSTGIENLPVLGLVILPNGTPAPQAHLLQKLNVRSGPGTHYESLGILPSDSLVWLIGRNQSASWLMIDYPIGPGGKGWIIANFVQAENIFILPIMDASGAPLVETPSSQVTYNGDTPTPTFVPAFEDGDSAINPSASVVFSPLGIQSFSFTSDISYPQGDQEDWIAFRSYASQPGAQAFLSASLTCIGNGSIQFEILKDSQPISNWGNLVCGNTKRKITLDGNSDYLFHLSIQGVTDFRYAFYSLTVQNSP